VTYDCKILNKNLKQVSRTNLGLFERSEFAEFVANIKFLLLRNFT